MKVKVLRLTACHMWHCVIWYIDQKLSLYMPWRHILNLATRLVWVVGSTPLQLYSQCKSTLFLLSGSQSQSTCFGKEVNILAVLAINHDYIYENTLATCESYWLNTLPWCVLWPLFLANCHLQWRLLKRNASMTELTRSNEINCRRLIVRNNHK